MRFLHFTLIFTALLLLLSVIRAVPAQTAGGARESEPFELEQVVTGLEHPWGIAIMPDGRLLVTERPGRLNLIENGRVTSVAGLPSISGFGQGGLLDVTLHPGFANNSLVYFSFAEIRDGRAGTAVARGRLQGNRLTNVETIYSLEPKTQRRQHFGSRLTFLPDGTLLVTIGDRGWPDAAQDTTDHAGSTLRIGDDGSIPEDNPFIDDRGFLPELFTIGNRNSQGMTVHPETGEIWQSEHGPRGGDELNLIRPGRNYGWPVISHGTDYRTGEQIGRGTHAPGMEQPVVHWTPAIAPAGITFYFGDAFPRWRGSLFISSLVGRHLRRLEFDERNNVVDQQVLLQDRIGRIRDVAVGLDGFIYLLSDERNGGVYRIRSPR